MFTSNRTYWIVAALASLLMLAAFVVVAIVIPRQQHEQAQDKIAANLTSLMLVNHLKQHGTWPHSWEELADHFPQALREYDPTPFKFDVARVKERVDVNFQLDLSKYDFNTNISADFVAFTTATGNKGNYAEPFIWRALAEQSTNFKNGSVGGRDF